MKIASFVLLTILAVAARADFSYVMTPQGGGPASAGTKYYFKGQKMAIVLGQHTTVLDFDTLTATGIDADSRSYNVTKFTDFPQMKNGNEDVKLEVKETGEKKMVNGFNATELLMTATMNNPQKQGMTMTAEIEMWISPDPPGASEARAFYRRNSPKFPWAALGQGAPNNSMRQAMVEMQKKLTEMDGIMVQQVIHMKLPGAAGQAGGDPRMAAARARLEEMAKGSGPAAAQAQQALARMNAMGGGGGGMDITMNGGNYSTSSISDSVFSVPAGFTQKTGH